MYIVNQMISSLLQLAIVLLLAFVLKAIFQKDKRPYLEWISLKKTAIDYKAILLISVSYLLIALLPVGWLYQGGQMNNADALTVKAYLANGLDVQTLLVILLWAVIQTSLTEEILFRGSLLNTFRQFTSPQKANVAQALLFSLMHLPALKNYGLLPMAFIGLMTFPIAYALGWLVINRSHFSIINTWIIHASVNLISQIGILLFYIK